MTLAYGMRFTAGLPFAAMLSVLLILLMQAMIAVEAPSAEPPSAVPTIEITSVIKDTPPQKALRPELKTHVEPPLPTFPKAKGELEPPGGTEIPGETQPTHSVIDDLTSKTWTAALPLTPILLGEQRYPPRMLERGIEGTCDVVFDITGAGTTTNVRATDCTHPGFVREAESAAAKYRYTASDGRTATIQRRGQTLTLAWRMPDD